MRSIRKAVVPAAGLGTRLYPASKAVKKEFFPIVSADGMAKPAIQAILEEATGCGIEQVCLVVQKEDISHFRRYFGEPLSSEFGESLAAHPEILAEAEKLQDLGKRIEYVVQHKQEGFGHAVHCAKSWVGDTPFLLLLGDHVYKSHAPANCASQVLAAYELLGRSVCALARTPGNKVERYGVVAADPVPERPRTYRLSEVREKPSLDYARTHLRVEGLGPDEYFCMFGQYVFTPALFDHLEHHISRDIRQRGEIQLTGALEMLRQQEGAYGYETAGECYDIGTPLGYVESLVAFSGLHTDSPRPS